MRFGEHWCTISGDGNHITDYFQEYGRQSVAWMADLIPRMSVCTRYGYELGFYDVKFAGIRPVEWRGLYFKVPDRISVALATLVELSMTHNVIGVDATRGDIFFEKSNDHQTNINYEVVGSFLDWMKYSKKVLDA